MKVLRLLALLTMIAAVGTLISPEEIAGDLPVLDRIQEGPSILRVRVGAGLVLVASAVLWLWLNARVQSQLLESLVARAKGASRVPSVSVDPYEDLEETG
jgi:hypothetical protein